MTSASLERLAPVGLVLALWAQQLLWSKAWLDRFRRGPVEWLWPPRTALRT